ncbi:MAG: GerMN domain-containing protein [Negativicutes bacterium]
MKARWTRPVLWAILAMLLVSGCASVADTGIRSRENNAATPEVQKTPESSGKEAVDTIPVKVYFGAHDAQHLEAEVHWLKRDDLLMQQAMKLLVQGPRNPNLWAVLPSATRVKSVSVHDRIAQVDFSDEIVKQSPGGSSREILAVGAIVNTLTEFAAVERVQILVDGKKVNTLFGHVDVSEPLGRSAAIIKEK